MSLEKPLHEMSLEIFMKCMSLEMPHYEINLEKPIQEISFAMPPYEMSLEKPHYEMSLEMPLHEMSPEMPLHEMSFEMPLTKCPLRDTVPCETFPTSHIRNICTLVKHSLYTRLEETFRPCIHHAPKTESATTHTKSSQLSGKSYKVNMKYRYSNLKIST